MVAYRFTNCVWIAAILLSPLVGCTHESGPSAADNPRVAARKVSLPAVGSTVILKPAPAVAEVQTSIAVNPTHVFLKVVADNQPLAYASPAILQLYAHSEDTEPLYSFTAAQLKAMAVTTNCPAAVAKYMDGVTAGEALFCNGAMDLSKVHYFELRASADDKDVATSYTVDFVDKENGVSAITIVFN